ncbi:hypothetical protein [Actinoplanes derwentensis]|uniref:Uncharacterized protein n=1 Tax=Actinoplanes derwentensis TaxID=113562 RepID=A0A1H1W8K3_9ACTN|nr:hypothetical protein [Actinoplanes derwentensis]GID84071.1 hypothetical protein Ade03nite_29950 [Actinoplanes derwentensis]SDS92766.1 hypothetical protein SAMN04489716_2004 [Actinoplanes derwentensis]
MAKKRGFLFQTAAAVLVAALSALTWYAWLGWDDQYQLDPATGVESGPYEAGQISGCAVTLLVLLVTAVLAGAWEVPAATALTLGFTVVFTIDAARKDESGLFAVGAVLVFLGVGMASGVVSAIMFGIRDRRASRRGQPAQP